MNLYQDIFWRGVPVFFDVSALDGFSEWYERELKDAGDFKDVKLETLTETARRYREFADCLSDERTDLRFCSWTCAEVERFRIILENKLEYLGQTRKMPSAKNDIAHEKKKRLKEVLMWYSCLSDAAQTRLYKPQDAYLFRDLFFLLADIADLRFMRQEYLEKEDLLARTDEAIVASAICYSIENQKTCGIFHGDKHLAKLLTYFSDYLKEHPELSDLSESVAENAVWAYNRNTNPRFSYLNIADLMKK